MARRPRAPKPKVELVYEESSTIAAVANRLIRLFPVQFGWTSNFRLGYLIVRGSKPKSGDRDVAGKFRKVPPVYHGLTGFDAVVEIHAWAWDDLDATQQEALVAHELCHGSMSERGTLRVEKHDLTEFHWVVGQYGAWAADVRTFAEQLSMFNERGPALGRPQVVQRQAFAGDDADLRPKGEVNVDELRGAAERESEPTPIRRPKNGGTQPPAPH